MSDYKYDNKIFIDRASELIFNSGKTQAELVELLGLSNGSIANLKNKEGQIPSAKTICALAKNFNVSTDWLLGLTDVQTTDKATKELCDTLGLSEQSIECLQDSTDEYAKKSIDWLIAQHINSIADKAETFKEVLAKNKGVYDLRNVPIDVIYGIFGILDNSILCNLYSLLTLENENSDIVLRTNGNAIHVNLFSDEKALVPLKIDATEYEVKLPIGEFSYKEGVCAKHKNAIQRELDLLVQKITENQEDFTFNKTIERLSELSSEQQEQQNGNDKKEE